MRGAIWGLPEGFVPPYRPIVRIDNRKERENLNKHRELQEANEKERQLREEAAK